MHSNNSFSTPHSFWIPLATVSFLHSSKAVSFYGCCACTGMDAEDYGLHVPVRTILIWQNIVARALNACLKHGFFSLASPDSAHQGNDSRLFLHLSQAISSVSLSHHVVSATISVMQSVTLQRPRPYASQRSPQCACTCCRFVHRAIHLQQ